MPFLAAAAIIRFTSSSVIAGGDAERSVAGWNVRHGDSVLVSLCGW
jgi:hypothetical protein